MGEFAVDARQLCFAYGSRMAVDHVDVQIGRGEILGLLGPNGAGKSTTIRMLIGLLTPHAGTIHILGMPHSTRRRDINRHLGVVFEEKNLYDALTGRENLRFFASLFGAKPDIDGLLETVGLATRGDHRVRTYSKGMRQRLTLARALVNSPEVLFLDEPTDGLDPVSARLMRSLIRQKADEGVAVLLTTHDMHEADELSDNVAFIHGGRVLARDTPAALKTAHRPPSVRVTHRDASGHLRDETLGFDHKGRHKLRALLEDDTDLVSIATEQATLEDVFVDLAGRPLT